jgi:SAM-dependent methyltransferase
LELVIDHFDPLQASYDAVAEEYVRQGPVWDLGCGPGHVARYLLDRGVTVAGLDLSAALVACARQLNPTISFRQGDCRRLPALDHTLAGIVAFYSIIHLPRQEVTPTLVEWRRAVKVGGLLLLAVHLGEDALHLEEWWGHRVSLDFAYFQTAEMIEYLEAAAWRIEETTERDPYPGVETQTRRVYILANATPA